MRTRNLLTCFLAIVLVLGMFVFLGCGADPAVDDPEPAEEPEEEEEETEEPEETAADVQEITLAITRDPEFLDPAHLSWTSAHGVANNIFNGLVKWETGTFDIVPDLAYDWDISEDGRTYTFYLHEGVQWHGGYGEFTADDVKFTFERALDPETGSRWDGLINLITDIVVVDDYTVEIHIEEASPVFIHNMSAYRPGKIMSRAAYEDIGDDYNFEPIGTGPFQFERWIPHEEIVLVAFDDYFEGAPTLRKATFLVIAEDTVGAMAVEAGEIDTMLVSLEEIYDKFMADPDIVVQELPSTGTRYLQIKTVLEPFTDVRVRQAMAHAIDRQAIADMVGMGTLPLVTQLPQMMFGYDENVPVREYDPELAMDLLAEAGYPDGFETQYYGRDIEIERDVFTLMQSQLAQVGIDVEYVMMDSTAWMTATTAGESPLAWLSLSARYDPDAILSGFFHGDRSSPEGRNFTWWGGADDLINAGRVEMDEARRAEIYFDLQVLFNEEVPSIPLYQPTNVRALHPWVKGFQLGQVEDTYLYNTYIEGRGR